MMDIVERLRQPIWTEDVMKRWDHVRSLIADGHKGSLPRDIIESDLDGWDIERKDAADEITRLRTRVTELEDVLEDIAASPNWPGIARAALHEGREDAEKEDG